jgi:hypothetical protein
MYILYKKNKYKEYACVKDKKSIKIFQKAYKRQFNIITYIKQLKGGDNK